jgi:thiol:disulfide interchange protein DsbD
MCALRRLIAMTMVAVLAVLLLAPHSAVAEEDFLDPEKAFVFSGATQVPDRLDVHFKIAPHYYMYRERFAFAVEPQGDAGRLGPPEFPVGIVKYDETFEKDLEVYYDQITIQVPLQAGAGQPLTVSLTSQGCADAGLCYPPMTHDVVLTPTDAGYSASGQGIKDRVPAPEGQQASGAAGSATSNESGVANALTMNDMGFASYLADASPFQIVLLCLLLGVLLSFTPCVLPMVPILLAILAGKNRSEDVTRWRGASLAAIFVLGMSLVYTALGIAAGLVGASMANWLQTPWVLSLFALLLAVLSLAMFDVFTIQVPAGMQSALSARLARIPGGRYGAVFLMGMVSALIVGPCIAAPLAGILLFSSQTGDVALGGTALFALAWGEGLLLLAVGASSGLLLPKAGPWMEGIKRLFGVMLLATAWWMVGSIIPASVMLLGWALLAIWSATMLRAFEPVPASAGVGRYLNKAAGLLLGMWAAILVVGLAAGGNDVLRPLAPFAQSASGASNAQNLGAVLGQDRSRYVQVRSVAELDNLLANVDRPVMLDFYADWCVSCIEMERFTFSDPAVAQQMSKLLVVQADVTKNTDDDRALLKRFSLFGPPGILFFDAQGKPLDDFRVVGFKNAESFGEVLSRVLAS